MYIERFADDRIMPDTATMAVECDAAVLKKSIFNVLLVSAEVGGQQISDTG